MDFCVGIMRASSQYFCKSLMRDLTDQSHANWIIAYQNMEKEWGIQALCGEGEYLDCMVSMVECGRVS